jgi:small subunit ribosomal protein S16
MLAIRMQRTGRSGHAQFRMIVQDRRFHPTSGRVVAYLGNYDPHSKQSNFDKEKLESYLANGAQPSPRVIKLLKSQKIKLPDWVNEPAPKEKAVRNPEKRRSTRPKGAPEPKVTAPVEETPAEETTAEKEMSEAAAEPETEAETAKEAVEPQAEENASSESAGPASEPTDKNPEQPKTK